MPRMQQAAYGAQRLLQAAEAVLSLKQEAGCLLALLLVPRQRAPLLMGADCL